MSWRDQLEERHRRLTRFLWGLIPGIVVVIALLWIDSTFLAAVFALSFTGYVFYLTFLLLRGVFRGWKDR